MERNLQTLNQEKKLAVWAERISACRNSRQGVKSWCRENHICEATYYKWQRKVFELIQTQQVHFAEITPQPQPGGNIAVTVRVAEQRRRFTAVQMHNCGAGAAGFKVMLNDFTGAEKVYIACGYTDLRRGSTDWLPWCSRSSHWIPLPIRCFCSATDGGTGSRLCTGRATALCCCTSDWRGAAFNGPEMRVKPEC